MSFTDEGSTFVFGYLVTAKPFLPFNIEVLDDADNDLFPVENKTEFLQAIAEAFNTPNSAGGSPFDTVFMFKTLSVIYFFSFCVSMLFYIGVLQWMVMKVQKVFTIMCCYVFELLVRQST